MIKTKQYCFLQTKRHDQTIFIRIYRGSFEVKLPTIWTDEKHRWEESEKRREEKKKEDQRRERVRKKKMQVREKEESGGCGASWPDER